jgi:N-acetylmuramoyl-L-alanine amidase
VNRVLIALFALTVTACASNKPVVTAPQPATNAAPVAAAAPADRGTLPAIPPVDGAVRIRVMYPDSNAALAARDSNFIFGSVGSGRAALTINGAPVNVAPNGAFLAYLPIPQDGMYRLQATKDGQSDQMTRPVRTSGGGAATVSRTRIISISPSGALAVPRGGAIAAALRGTAGGRASFVTASGVRYPLVENRDYSDDTAPGADFQTRPAATTAPRTTATYNGVVPVTASWTTSDTSVARAALQSRALPGDTARGNAYFELIVGGDTVRAPARLNVAAIPADYPIVGVVQAPAGSGPQWRTRGRVDTSGPYHYFWPSGTRFQILGERDGFYQVRLANNKSAYIPAREMRVLPSGTPIPGGAVASVRFAAQRDYIDLRIPLPEMLPFQVNETERSLSIDVFGAVSRVNYFQYGTLDPLIERAEWSEPTDSVYRVTVNLSRFVWGYDTFYDGSTLILRIRRPPVIDVQNPLRGLLIAVDAGHPPGGAIGPTGLTEAQANLALAMKLRDLLTAAGARVLMTRTDSSAVPLDDRPQMATDSNAHVLISIHNNAFPDGVNPFANNGTSVYYYHPQSAQLARLMQGELLNALGLRDIGIGRADLSLVRATWMPAVLTESSFLMIPEQEAAMRNPDVQERDARAHLRALEAFLRERAH